MCIKNRPVISMAYCEAIRIRDFLRRAAACRLALGLEFGDPQADALLRECASGRGMWRIWSGRYFQVAEVLEGVGGGMAAHIQ